jgi:lysophospholipase L1-like esterase
MRSPQSHFVTIGIIATAICVCSLCPANGQDQATQVGAAETWLRQTVEISGTVQTDTVLKLSATNVTSVYFNGQRLLRNRAVNGVVAWKIGTLIRNGANCIAVAAGKADAGRPLTAWLISSNGLQINYSQWKMTADIPPVGWQKTDFNDRDWTPAPTQPAATTLRKATATQLSWIADDNTTHVENGRLRIRNGDHVVLLGGTFIERAQQYGYLECALTTSATEHNVTFRNLGWSADTVFAESRGIFDAPAKGYERMIEHVRAEEPTLILVCYGQNEALSFAGGAEGIDRFKAQLKVLHRDLTASGADVVFLTPHPFVTLATPLPDAAKWNQRLSDYAAAVIEVGAGVGSFVADLNGNFVRDVAAAGSDHFGGTPAFDDPDGHPELTAIRNSMWTDNGMHWNAAGYKVVASVVASRLFGGAAERPLIVIDTEVRTVTTEAGEIRNIKWQDDNADVVSFQYRRKSLTTQPVAVDWRAVSSIQPVISIDSGSKQDAVGFVAAGLAAGSVFVAQRANDFEELRQLVTRKNELYFHRWRPQNITYLFGFRKHEQGNNASDIAKFDPLIETLEREIHAAKQPQWQTVRVTTAE